ncbi:MAG: hypothetical protein U9M95_05995 [Candidatus Altiarchaeota archaeon]|nr:hypothetical protein [Candidatus Altiarchaeota archaeon]
MTKNKTGKGVILLMALYCMFSVSATKIELGSVPGNNQGTIYPGDSGSFTVSLFNMGRKPIYLSTKLEYDREIGVEVAPKEIVLSNEVTRNDTSHHASWLILGDGRTYVRLYPIKVYVYVPDAVSRDTYNIKLIATARGTGGDIEEGYGQEMAQVREYMFTVKTMKTVSTSAGETDEAVVIYDRGPERTKPSSTDDESGEETPKSTGTRETGNNIVYPSAGGSSTQGGEPYKSKTIDSSQDSSPLGISQDKEGNTNINLPTGKIVLDKKQTETVMDVGLITLIVSVLSLAVRIIK